MKGTIIRATGSWYTVRTDDGRLFDCKVKGTFRLKGIRSTNPVAVGDVVSLTPGTDGLTALIDGIEDRRNYIIRRASNLSKQSHIIAANVDMAVLIVTVAHPETSTTFIDRFLSSAEAYQVPVLILFNKQDLYDKAELEHMGQLIALYRGIGYVCLACSATEGSGLEELKAELRGKTTLLSGNSGVGKSTLLNRLVPDAGAKTAEISAAHDSGMHTTTFSQMYFLPGGGSLFREIFSTSADCRFGNCTHTHEPGCAVLQAVAEGRIAESRFTSYLSMLDDKNESRYREAQ